ncbi:capsular biosynthesis protein [Candidatus Izimaplasma bacterium ZiA1]|uniref:DegT/DnrJ/EryC1/StrS family aminotransferase n=1 Tax=Candidatus Izimoplasma sp. ZiA1 TaxID=2024899 RepID=UPI000BAA82CE|nr:capsular biosynthesis protein [Candidatus Izimaplasma bacterium ZiA1]
MIENRNIPFSPPDITEEEISCVVDTLRSGWITTGPKTKAFESEIAKYIGVKKAVCLNSATAALENALRILGIGPGDEVITTAYTYTASASVIHHVGAKIILIDTCEHSFEIDYNQMENAINEKTKAIIPVDIAGVICDYNKIFEIAERKKNLYKHNNNRQKEIGRVAVIADAAHSFGAYLNGKISGMLADITCFSFHAVKNLTTAEGGAIVWTNSFGLSDDDLYNEFMLYSLHGQSKDALSKVKLGSWEYDIVYPGYKSNMTDIQASIGIVQLKRYKGMLLKRCENFKLYNTLLDNKIVDVMQHKGANFESSYHLLVCNVKDFSLEERNHLIDVLALKGISSNVHYKPLPLMTAYKLLGFDIGNYPNAYKKYKNVISLPLYSTLSSDDIHYICKNFNQSVYKILGQRK